MHHSASYRTNRGYRQVAAATSLASFIGVTVRPLTTASGLGPQSSLEVRPEIGAFWHGTGFVVLQFDSPADDPVPTDFATSLAQKQADNIKAGLS
jgi:hypothetical protein